MTTTVPPAATPAVPIDIDISRFIADTERYVAAHAPAIGPRTAHRLITKTTAQLVAEALGTPTAAADPAPVLQAPPAMLRHFPNWALGLPMVRSRFGGGGQHVTVAQHLNLTAAVIERWGWAQGCLRTRNGICIEGAQFVLLRLGYGNGDTLHAATNHLHQLFTNAGAGSLTAWNDHPDRTQVQVLNLLNLAARTAGGA